ncbi:MAG: hypothetical protein JETCAE02_20280 [Anaerolineaceae bacterium]|nr:MBOAT family protein [Anaerolineae bacterium]MBL1171354.1 MBOAT family protein [Chloroflexota bacterium]MDL1924694.1 MBOAT family protein [Anaerolineae bacterium AMX1]WKZ52282.1 MAG: MBOAT family O-acyltransferase [Anaerolineales bacterium]GJQ39616.1 MAG: hypothetical protein JETCAE02_20280 [Anaerolineaceae bacterium]
MTVVQILILAGFAILLGLLRRGRSLALMGASALAIYWLQPQGSPFSFWFPTLTLALTALAWAVAAPSEARGLRQNWPALAVLFGVSLAVALPSRLPLEARLFPPPGSLRILVAALGVVFALVILLSSLRGGHRPLLTFGALILIVIFVFLKSPALPRGALTFLDNLRGRAPDPKTLVNFAWLGYSYLAFRILHTLRDRQDGLLPAVGLAEYVNYVIFFPSFTAGPIDRLERFIKDLRVPLPLANDDMLFAGQRLALGLFKKFFVADLLALVSVNDALIAQTRSGGWLWLELFAYTLRVYFDFSGYTDIAIGTARLLGVRLPENFDAPFLKPNLAQFWNAWHMTLTQWFRAYFFNPFNRALRSAKRPLPAWLMILLTQVTTMLLIGLWHGVTWNYALWGLWHGIGLFLQNRWSEFVRRRFPDLGAGPVSRRVFHAGGAALTFVYFSLGMAFFALSTPRLSLAAFMKLFGIS